VGGRAERETNFLHANGTVSTHCLNRVGARDLAAAVELDDAHHVVGDGLAAVVRDALAAPRHEYGAFEVGPALRRHAGDVDAA